MSFPQAPDATAVPLAGSSPSVARGAQAISHVASPPVLSLVGLAIIAIADGTPAAMRAASAVAVVGVLLPTAVTAMLLWRGRVSDIEITTRSERVWPLLLTTICLVTAGVLAWSNDAPPAVVGLAVILGLQAFATLLVSLSWKISVHCLSATTIGGLVWCLWGEPLPLLFIAPAMIWSRLYLKRHTPPQTIAGSVFGVASILTLWPVLVG